MDIYERKNWKKFIKQRRDRYMKIGPIACPAFDNEKIYFTQAGFNHLIRKGRIPRKRDEQMRRLTLVSLTSKILSSSKAYSVYEKRFSSGSSAEFWSFTMILEENGKEKSVTVIVRQLAGKSKHFFSVFDERHS